MTTGEYIRHLREQNGLAQADFAYSIGVRQNRVSEWETGKGLPSFSNAIKIADYFGITLDELAGRSTADTSCARA
jgi:transcriptional regulator with XRE-family HTH domain